MLLQSLDDLRIDGAPLIEGLLFKVFVKRLRQPEIEPDRRLGEFALSHDTGILLL